MRFSINSSSLGVEVEIEFELVQFAFCLQELFGVIAEQLEEPMSCGVASRKSRLRDQEISSISVAGQEPGNMAVFIQSRSPCHRILDTEQD
jgi:hypothetical protein